MSRSFTNRLAVRPLLRPSRAAPVPICARNLSQTGARRASSEDDAPPKKVPAMPTQSQTILESMYSLSPPSNAPSKSNAMANLSQNIVFQALDKSSIDTSILSGRTPQAPEKKEDELEPYHFHVYAHKHNTHITCTKPSREPIISLSCGNLGFRKSRRGTFDSAYSLIKYVLDRLVHTGWPMKMNRLELVLRGFGQGREAVIKVLTSPEGKILRDKIVRVADSTRIKFGGTRSEKPRRL